MRMLSQADRRKRQVPRDCIALVNITQRHLSCLRPSSNLAQCSIMIWSVRRLFFFAYLLFGPVYRPQREREREKRMKTQTQLLHSHRTTVSRFGILGHLGNLIFQLSLLLFSGPKGGQMKHCALPLALNLKEEKKIKLFIPPSLLQWTLRSPSIASFIPYSFASVYFYSDILD
jgi:hypothetical protein